MFQSKEKRYAMQEETTFRLAVFQRERARLERFTSMIDIEASRKLMSGILKWDNHLQSSVFLFLFVISVWFIELWMIPLVLSFVLVKVAVFKLVSGKTVEIKDIQEIHNEEV